MDEQVIYYADNGQGQFPRKWKMIVPRSDRGDNGAKRIARFHWSDGNCGSSLQVSVETGSFVSYKSSAF